MQTISPLDYEKSMWAKGYTVIGVDEVGRGPLAGPIVAAAICIKYQVFSMKGIPMRIDDSKKLTSAQREQSAIWLVQNCLGFAVGQVSVGEIDKLGIARANILAMRLAVISLIKKLERGNFFVLSDYFQIPGLKQFGITGQENLVHGDERSFSIAASSIIAKVYRDKLMRSLSKDFPEYGWQTNMGYGTRAHIDGLIRFGPTPHHRKLFIRKFV